MCRLLAIIGEINNKRFYDDLSEVPSVYEVYRGILRTFDRCLNSYLYFLKNNSQVANVPEGPSKPN